MAELGRAVTPVLPGLRTGARTYHRTRDAQRRVYPPDERPDIEVLVNGQWLVGELRVWTQQEDGSWWGDVRYRLRGPTRHLGSFPAAQVCEHLPTPGAPQARARARPTCPDQTKLEMLLSRRPTKAF